MQKPAFSFMFKLILCYTLKVFYFPHSDPTTGGGVDQLESEPVQAQRRSSMLDENRTDTLIASDASLRTDSIIRGNGCDPCVWCVGMTWERPCYYHKSRNFRCKNIFIVNGSYENKYYEN